MEKKGVTKNLGFVWVILLVLVLFFVFRSFSSDDSLQSVAARSLGSEWVCVPLDGCDGEEQLLSCTNKVNGEQMINEFGC